MKLLLRAVLALACALGLNTISQAQTMTPTITWGPINAVTLGTALTPTQLNATASVSGTFIYSPAAGSVLPVGLGIISVTFIPSDTVDFTNATATNTMLVVAPSLTPVYSLNLPAIDSVNWAALLNQNFVTLDKLLSGSTPLSGTLNAPTASALFANPAQCSAGQAFIGIDVHGNSVGCFTPSGGGGGGLSSFTVGNLSPLFTATLGGSPLTNPALAFTLSNAAANTVFGNFTGTAGAPGYSAAPVFSAANLTNFPTLNQNTTGNAATASALAGTPTLCSTGTAPTGILANGNATGCASISSGGITALTGDATASGSGSVAVTVVKINGTSLAGLATGILKNTTTTGVPSIAIASDFPTLNQNTTGTASNITGVLNASSEPAFTGDVTKAAGSVATTVTKINGVQLSTLGSGILKIAVTTGIPSIAFPGSDYVIPSGNITGTSANITGVLGSGSMPTFTGDVTNSGLAMTVAKLGGVALIANTTVTIGTTAIAANTCNTVTTATMTGLATTSTINFTPNADVAATTGWGGTGGLVIDAWPSAANTLSYKTCNQTAASITPGASVTFNVSAR
jgi:hypothetical protein